MSLFGAALAVLWCLFFCVGAPLFPCVLGPCLCLSGVAPLRASVFACCAWPAFVFRACGRLRGALLCCVSVCRVWLCLPRVARVALAPVSLDKKKKRLFICFQYIVIYFLREADNSDPGTFFVCVLVSLLLGCVRLIVSIFVLVHILFLRDATYSAPIITFFVC